MPLLPSPPLITADGSYELSGLAIGKKYLLTLKGTFEGATVYLHFWDNALGEFTLTKGGVFNGDDEVRLVTPSSLARLTFAGTGTTGSGNTRIAVTFIPII